MSRSAYINQIKAYQHIQAINQSRAVLKRDADNLLQIHGVIDCDEWKTLMSMKDGSEEDLTLAENIIENLKLKLKVPMPQKGSVILWYGTQYTVDSVEEDRVTVTMRNGQQITFWWWYTEGCKILKL